MFMLCHCNAVLAAGGGLDSQKLRRLLRSKCFAESEAAPTFDALTGRWAARDARWQVLYDRRRGETIPTAVSVGRRPSSAISVTHSEPVGYSLEHTPTCPSLPTSNSRLRVRTPPYALIAMASATRMMANNENNTVTAAPPHRHCQR